MSPSAIFLSKSSFETLSIFDLKIPKQCLNVPDEILNPSSYWSKEEIYWENAKKLALLYKDNFIQFESEDTLGIKQYGPQI